MDEAGTADVNEHSSSIRPMDTTETNLGISRIEEVEEEVDASNSELEDEAAIDVSYSEDQSTSGIKRSLAESNIIDSAGHANRPQPKRRRSF